MTGSQALATRCCVPAQREVLLALAIASTNPLKVHFIQTFIEFRRSGGAWKVSYVGPRGGGPPVPAASP